MAPAQKGVELAHGSRLGNRARRATLAFVHPWDTTVYLCQLQISASSSDPHQERASMLIHAQSHAQALLAAQELFPSCQVEVLCRPNRGAAGAAEHCET